MDLKSLLQSKKNKLNPTKTVLTNTIGEKFEIFQGKTTQLNIKGSPFVVDEKPDLQMAPIIPGIFLSSQDPVVNPQILKSYKIKNILSLGIKPFEKYDGIEYYFVDILDVPEFNLLESLKRSFEIIEGCRQREKNILVHCNAGVSRSPTIIIGYLMIYQNLSFDEAYSLVKKIRTCIRPNDGFLQQLKILKSEDFPERIKI